MATKYLSPIQCNVLHPIYGIENCCICQANIRIKELQEQLALKDREIEEYKQSLKKGGLRDDI